MRKNRVIEAIIEMAIIIVCVSLIAILIGSCSTKQETSPIVVPDPSPPVVVTPDDTMPLRQEILKIVKDSPCSANSVWKDRGLPPWKNRRGRAPRAYLNGMAITYAKQVCGQGSDFIKPNTIVGSNSIGKHNDALRHYGLAGGQLQTYAFLIGLGMRESSGKYCKGRDRSASWTQPQNAEAGLFQAAYVSRVFNKELKPLFDKYQADRSQCELNVFSEGISCTSYDAKTYGSGDGARFQELAKQCPAFAVQWAAILIRSQLRHFGPIIRKEVEYMKSCESMLKNVEKVVEGNCSEL